MEPSKEDASSAKHEPRPFRLLRFSSDTVTNRVPYLLTSFIRDTASYT